MTGSSQASSTRHSLRGRIVDSALDTNAIRIVTGPRGIGKTTILLNVRDDLAIRGVPAALLDLERTCTTPTDFAQRFLTGITQQAAGDDAAPGPLTAGIIESFERELERRKPDPVFLIESALSYPRGLAEDTGRRLVLLIDEIGELCRLAHHPGLRDGLRLIAGRMAGATGVAVIATASPASRPGPLLEAVREVAGDRLVVEPLPSMNREELAVELAGAGCPVRDPSELERWQVATGGHPAYVRILARRVSMGADLAGALIEEMAPPLGALFQECRFDYHLLIERSRGHGVVKSILDLLAHGDSLNLVRIARHLRIAPPTALDYLAWLLEVGLIRKEGRSYVVRDPLLELWIRLNGHEPVDPQEEIRRFLEQPHREPAPPAPPRGRRPGATARPAPVPPPRVPEPAHDALMEID
jgi:hypothetical protein